MVIRTDVRRTFTHAATLRGSQWYITLGLNEHSYDWFIQPSAIKNGVSEFWRQSQGDIIRVVFNNPVSDDVRGKILRQVRAYYPDSLLYVQTYSEQQSEYRFWFTLNEIKRERGSK